MEGYNTFEDYYKILGVSKDASAEEIKKAYRKLSLEYHPDKHTQEPIDVQQQFEEKMKKVNAAYETLKDITKRQEYDREHTAYYEERARRQQQRQQTSGQRQQSQQGQRQQTSGEQQRRQTSGNTQRQQTKKQTEEEEVFFSWKSAVEDIKKAWSEVKEEEKDFPSFFKRHRILDREIKNNDKASRTTVYTYYDDLGFEHTGKDVEDRTIPQDVVFQVKRGTIHVVGEFLVHLERLSHITHDSFPKYVLRNRRLVAAMLAVLMATGIANIGDGNEPVQPNTTTGQHQQQQTPLPTEDLDLGADVIAGEEERIEEARVNAEYKVYREYTIKYGDTLSELAEAANISTRELQYYNDIDDASRIKAGDEITIPYFIESGDFHYATKKVVIPEGMSLETFAALNNTTVGSLFTLNPDAVVAGIVVEDEIYVPTFTSKEQIEEQKATAQAEATAQTEEAKVYTYRG